MNILSLENVSKNYGIKPLFEDVTLGLEDRDKIGIIGANGSGKTNFLSFFEFLNHLYQRKLTEYIALNGGEDRLLHHGSKVTEQIEAKLSFDNAINSYSFILEKGNDGLTFTNESLWYNNNDWDITDYKKEANVKNRPSQL